MARLFLVNQFANTPSLPGHTRQYEIALELVRFGWRVQVFASDFNLSQRKYKRIRFPFLWATENLSGIRWTWLWSSPYWQNNWLRYVNLTSFCFHIAFRLPFSLFINYLQGKSKAIVLASSPQLPACFVCLCIARITGSPFILEVRDLWPQILIDMGGKTANSLSVRFLGWIEKMLYVHSDAIVVVANGFKEYVRDRGAKCRIEWLPNGPDLNTFKPIPLPQDHDDFVVLYAGAHGSANDLKNVVFAASILERANSRVRFRFIGDGPEKNNIIRLASALKSVSFEDAVSKEKIPSVVQDADAMLLSLKDLPLFRFGVSPNKLYDAYALGRPVITTVVAANEEVEKYNVGVTAPPGNPKLLAEAILRLSNMPLDERQGMASRAVELVQTTYSRQRISSRYNQLLKDLV